MAPNNTNPLDYTLLIKFIDGQASPAETAEVAAWLDAAPANRERYFQVKDILDQQRVSAVTREETDERWQQIAGQLQAAAEPVPLRRLSWLKYAAAVLVLVIGGGIAAYVLQPSPREEPLLTLVSQKATVQHMVLPDSTRVWIKPGGQLRYRNVKDGLRELWLEGSGYFEVVKNTATPFRIHTPGISVVVLGTSFTVNDDQHNTNVIVNTGMVKASAHEQEMLVRPGQRATVVSNTLRIDSVNAQLFAAWKDGDYKFENTSVAELKELLEANYGYEVTILQPQKFRTTSISGRMLITDAQSLCQSLSGMLEADVRKDGHRIIIQPK
ncbi:ferric-dicitrate binding protein FerR, regulates iron transport through sigma-19 [Chitinophaga eiseniae]|uniref:Ferric-dicitrate binding protein FerR, regulates iron transport through sigma-19 n=1 Tax=Chitinophaga eiseniae TaxID=634771 RepID=A0A1T4T6G4_9BACT|nr:FecR domain-containing protein [Chitinophaga eiseniae]SKA36064.1 ferric-dicitrate binding protein FerR, regulates iron transport through sigma-19 [Chitinophaga eiseniae]